MMVQHPRLGKGKDATMRTLPCVSCMGRIRPSGACQRQGKLDGGGSLERRQAQQGELDTGKIGGGIVRG